MCAEFGTRWKVGMLYVLVQVSEQVEESESSLKPELDPNLFTPDYVINTTVVYYSHASTTHQCQHSSKSKDLVFRRHRENAKEYKG